MFNSESNYANHFQNQVRWFNAPNLLDRQEYFANVEETSAPVQGPTSAPIEEEQTTQEPVYDPENSVPKDFSYNPRQDERARAYNQWTRIHDDSCNEQNRLRVGSKPMKYYVNQFNSPQVNPFTEFTLVGNQQTYNVRNDFERAIPSRLNNLPTVFILPYLTTPNLASANANRMYVETNSNLRFGQNLRNLKSQSLISEIDYNRYNPGVYAETVQNAGQFMLSGGKMQQPTNNDGYYNYKGDNNVIMGNSSVPYFGISSRDLIQNALETSGC